MICCTKVGVKLFDQRPPGFLLKSLFDFRLPEKVRQLKPCVVMSALTLVCSREGTDHSVLFGAISTILLHRASYPLTHYVRGEMIKREYGYLAKREPAAAGGAAH